MTREERELSIMYLKEVKEKYIEGEGYERHPLPEYYAIENAIKALEQESMLDKIRAEIIDLAQRTMNDKMQIVIELDKDITESINDGVGLTDCQYKSLVDVITNGTPLPKGHGRLGDIDALEKKLTNGINAGLLIEGYEDFDHINSLDDCVECVRYADTIIEADGEAE